MPKSAPVITRFAPSPTGYLHIGGARTALFNYLFARANGGMYLLRIEDTDQERSTPEATQAILDGLAWLGLPGDEAPLLQSKQLSRHSQIAWELLEKGAAYKCFCTPQELDVMREEARAAGHPLAYDKRWRERSDHPDNAPFTIRIKAPLEGSMVIEDAVQGRVEVAAGQLDDFVLLRADGTPTYMLAVVVDDHDMQITHIIRGDDHLNNAFRQRVIYEAMGWDVPVFAHIPLIHGADGAKLSKRHGALGVDAYRDMGYLPEALRNYLLRLGFSHGDDEMISDDQATAWFTLEALGRSPSRFDFAKLDHVNAHYLRQKSDAELAALALPFIHALLPAPLTAEQQAQFTQAMPTLKERTKTLKELAEGALFYFRPANPPEDDKATAELEQGLPLLEGFLPALQNYAGEWTHDALFAFAKAYAAAEDIKMGALMSPVRVALTGRTASPSLFDVMPVLGREETLARLMLATHAI